MRGPRSIGRARAMPAWTSICVVLAACATHPEPSTADAAALHALAPTGVLRASINVGNPVLATLDPGTGQPTRSPIWPMAAPMRSASPRRT